MSDLTYSPAQHTDRPIVWLHGQVKSPPFTVAGRLRAGMLLRLLQRGVSLGMPHSRPMPSIGARCHELRVDDADRTWRIVYRADPSAVVILEVFAKRTRATPARVIESCRRRLRDYDAIMSERETR